MNYGALFRSAIVTLAEHSVLTEHFGLQFDCSSLCKSELQIERERSLGQLLDL